MSNQALPRFFRRRGDWGGRFLVFLVLCRALTVAAHATAEDLQQHLLVVYNKSATDSERLARYYAEKRKIPEERVLGIDCPDSEDIDRATYSKKIFGPINSYLIAQGWLKREPSTLAFGPKVLTVQVATQNDIWAIVLIRGVPLRIQNDPEINDSIPFNKPELNTSAACVDSELSTLPVTGMPLSGPVLNPYYFSSYARDFDTQDARRQILVTRLDAPAASDVQRMIDESLFAEANRLTGYACLDARGITDKNNSYITGDDWLRSALISLSHEGWPIEFDNNPNVIPDNLPISQVALYLGWYTENAQGPFFHPPRRFAVGAVAYHLHSFSATTLRSKTAYWCGPLISAGAAASMGAVYEPYLDLTPHLDIFVDRLLKGYTYAEASYMSIKGLSWMITVIGDPLYRPFREKLPEALARARKENSVNLDWLELQQARIDFEKGDLTATDLKKRLMTSGADEISREGYGDILSVPDTNSHYAEIADAYRQAMNLYLGPVDQIRVGLKLARLQEQAGQNEQARGTLKRLLERWPRESAFYGVDTEVARLANNVIRPATEPALVTPAVAPAPAP